MLSDQINKDFISAYKNRDEKISSVLRMLKSAIKNSEIENKSALNDQDTIAIIKKEIKQRNETAAEYNNVGRIEAAQKELEEATIIEKYLPALLNQDQIKSVIMNTADEIGSVSMADFGKLMSSVMAKIKTEADGKLVSDLVRQHLQNETKNK